jgi:hypothetical protein
LHSDLCHLWAIKKSFELNTSMQPSKSLRASKYLGQGKNCITYPPYII